MSQEPAHFATEPIETLVPNTIRTLTVDAVEKAKSGHCGLPMGCADFAFVLWTKYLKFNPANPALGQPRPLRPLRRPRLDADLLAAASHRLREDDARSAQEFPPVGQPHARAIPKATKPRASKSPPARSARARAIRSASPSGQKFFAATFNTPDFAVSDHRVYAIVSDGDLQEGVSHEAAGLAGHLGLDNLVWFYDDNSVSIEGMTKLSYSDDVPSRFKGYHWHVISINGNDQSQIDAALKEAHATKGQPTIIIGKTVIGKGSPKLQGTPKAHSDAFGAGGSRRHQAQSRLARGRAVPRARAREDFLRRKAQGLGARKKPTGTSSSPSTPRRIPRRRSSGTISSPRNFPPISRRFCRNYGPEKPIATRNAGGEILKVLFGAVPNLIGGSADLAPSTKTWIKEFGSFEKGNYGGRNLHFGIREHGMGTICRRPRLLRRPDSVRLDLLCLHRLHASADPARVVERHPDHLRLHARFRSASARTARPTNRSSISPPCAPSPA